MEDTKQTNGNSPQPLSTEEATSISGGDASCPTTVTVGAPPLVVQQQGQTPADAFISVYEGFVDVTSHIIERVAASVK
jgi:hypothetical protein